MTLGKVLAIGQMFIMSANMKSVVTGWTEFFSKLVVYYDILHYYTKAEDILQLRRQWHDTRRCPRRIIATYVFVIFYWVYILTLLYLSITEADVRLQVRFGSVLPLVGVDGSMFVAISIVALPIPLYYLLIYPYCTTTNYYRHSILYPRLRLVHQLSLPVHEREAGFQRTLTNIRSFMFTFLVLTVFFAIFINYRLAWFMVEHKDYFFAGSFGWLRSMATVLSIWYTLVILVVVCHIFASMYVAIYYFSVFTFRDLDQSMELLHRKRFRWSDMRKFRNEHTLIVTRIIRFDSIIGNILLLFYVTNYPTNACFVIFVTHNKVQLVVLLYVLAYMLGQLVFLIYIHILAAQYSTRIHRFTVFLMSRLVRLRNRWMRAQVMEHLRMSNYIDYFHRKKRYGLTYGKLTALITFSAFLKLIYVYMKFVFYYYNQMRLAEA